MDDYLEFRPLPDHPIAGVGLVTRRGGDGSALGDYGVRTPDAAAEIAVQQGLELRRVS